MCMKSLFLISIAKTFFKSGFSVGIIKRLFVGKAKNKWNLVKCGIGNDRYYIVMFSVGKKTWTRKDWILLWY